MSRVCKHCGCNFSPYTCEACERKIGRSCKECHAEVRHGRIINQNIHIIGGANGPPGARDGDEAGTIQNNIIRYAER